MIPQDRMVRRIAIMTAINDLLKGEYPIAQDEGADSLRMVDFQCFPLRLLFGTETPRNFIALVEPPVPTDPDSSSGQPQKMSWELLVQVFMTYERSNAGDWRMPFRMESLVRQRLMGFRKQYFAGNNIAGRLGGLAGAGDDITQLDNIGLAVRYMSDIIVSAGVVRADEKSADRVLAWIPVEIKYTEGC